MKHLLFVFLIAMYAAGCASTIETTASKRQAEIVVDGDAKDWAGILAPTKQSNTELGVQYDGEYVYVCLVVPDRANQTQMLVGGFTVWFDPAGGTAKHFGVRCPIGRQEDARAMRQFEGPEGFRAFVNQAQQELLIEGEGAEPQRLTKMEAKGIQLQVSPSPKGFVYELRVPLRNSPDHPFAAGLASGTALGIGFETYDIGSARAAGGGGGGGGGRRGGGVLGGAPPSINSGGESPKMLNFWAHTSLQ